MFLRKEFPQPFLVAPSRWQREETGHAPVLDEKFGKPLRFGRGRFPDGAENEFPPLRDVPDEFLQRDSQCYVEFLDSGEYLHGGKGCVPHVEDEGASSFEKTKARFFVEKPFPITFGHEHPPHLIPTWADHADDSDGVLWD